LLALEYLNFAFSSIFANVQVQLQPRELLAAVLAVPRRVAGAGEVGHQQRVVLALEEVVWGW